MNMMMFLLNRDDYYLKLQALLLPSGSPIMALTAMFPISYKWLITQLHPITLYIPGLVNIQKAIENDHRHSGFSHL